MSFSLVDFVRESNRIEGILREPTPDEIEVHEVVLGQPRVYLSNLEEFVDIVAKARLREIPGMNVRVGKHYPPRGGTEIITKLHGILDEAYRRRNPYLVHRDYETLHPFMDGNGRSGRVLWLWMMGGEAPLGFLHTWYYQSLSANRK